MNLLKRALQNRIAGRLLPHMARTAPSPKNMFCNSLLMRVTVSAQSNSRNCELLLFVRFVHRLMVEVLNVDVNRWWLSGRRLTATLIKSLVSNEIDVRVEVPDEILESSENERVLLDMHRVGIIFYSYNLRYVQLLSEAGRDELKIRYRDELREL
jgi:hypothetical protein